MLSVLSASSIFRAENLISDRKKNAGDRDVSLGENTIFC